MYKKLVKLALILNYLDVCLYVSCIQIDNRLVSAQHDCFERIALGAMLPFEKTFRNSDTNSLKVCENLCLNDKECQTFAFGISSKGNGTCQLSAKSIDSSNNKPVGTIFDPDFDLYARKTSNCLVDPNKAGQVPRPPHIVESIPPRPQTQGTFPPTENTRPGTSVFLPPSSTIGTYPTDGSDGTTTVGFSTTPFGSSSSFPDSSSSFETRPSPTPEDLYTINNNYPATLPSTSNIPASSHPSNNNHNNHNNINSNSNNNNNNQNNNNNNNNPPANVPSSGQQPIHRPLPLLPPEHLPPDHPCSFCSQSHKKPESRPSRPDNRPDSRPDNRPDIPSHYPGNMPGPYDRDRDFDRDRYNYPIQGPDPFPGYHPEYNPIYAHQIVYGPGFPMEREYEMYPHNIPSFPHPPPHSDDGYGPSLSFAGHYPDTDMNAIQHSGGGYGGHHNSFPGGHRYPDSNQNQGGGSGPGSYQSGNRYPTIHNQGQSTGHRYPDTQNQGGGGQPSGYPGSQQPTGNRFPDYNQGQGGQANTNRYPSNNSTGNSGPAYNVVEETPDNPMKQQRHHHQSESNDFRLMD